MGDPKSRDWTEEHLEAVDSDESEEQSSDRRASSSALEGLGTRDESEDPSASAASRKRRRVTRACDECRKKKIKCDGRQPCSHCTVYSYDCSYDQPSNRRRNPAPEYVRSIEHRLRRAEALLRTFLPDLALDDNALNNLLPHGLAGPAEPRHGKGRLESSQTEPNLESMIGATGQLDIDERGLQDYHGHSSGLSFLRGMRRDFGGMLGPEQADSETASYAASRKASHFSSGSDRSSKSIKDSPVESNMASDLPLEPIARKLCGHALQEGVTLMPIVHQPSFYGQLNRLYNVPQEHYQDHDHEFLPLFYNVLALGRMLAQDEQSNTGTQGYVDAMEEGYRYFWAGRQLIDITDCRDLASLQAVVFMALFLQSSAKLSTCYTFIGVALRSALRMGLHRALRSAFDPIQAEVRKRVFFVIRSLDVTVGAMLGMPITLNESDIDQEQPLEINDEYITADGFLRHPEGDLVTMTAANANFKLANIVSKITQHVYPMKVVPEHKAASTSSASSNSISYAIIRDIENDLQTWMSQLPVDFKPSGGGANAQILRARQLLRMSYAFAQMMLYRPFLHYLSKENQTKPVDKRAHTCASACISVSRNTIRIAIEMQQSGLFNGSNWFSVYTTFFAILSLIFFDLENPSHLSSAELMAEAQSGRNVLASYAARSMAADRCTETLTQLFEQSSRGQEREPSSIRSTSGAYPSSPPLPPAVPSSSRVGQRAIKRASSLKSRPREHSMPPALGAGASQPIVGSARSHGNANIPFDWSQSSRSGATAVYQTPARPPYDTTQTRRRSHTAVYQTQTQDILPTTDISNSGPLVFPSNHPFEYPSQQIPTLQQGGSSEHGAHFFPGYDPFGQLQQSHSTRHSSDDAHRTHAVDPLMQYPAQYQGQPGLVQWETPTGPMSHTTSGAEVQSSDVEAWQDQVQPQDVSWMNMPQIFGNESWHRE
ncbi:MAG: hypothetical protein M1828_005887 [Chrysothrix sp. TS-e1954]|nr:MAG: hypothetical protein M1828_005887 [Chrysothrix sp. TS-e1954]